MEIVRGKVMIYGSKSHQVVIDKETMNYIEFGKGQRPLVILPGLGDGLSPVDVYKRQVWR